MSRPWVSPCKSWHSFLTGKPAPPCATAHRCHRSDWPISPEGSLHPLLTQGVRQPPREVPPGPVSHFQLKAIETLRPRGTFTSPLKCVNGGLAHSESYHQKQCPSHLSTGQGRLPSAEHLVFNGLLPSAASGTSLILSSEQSQIPPFNPQSLAPVWAAPIVMHVLILVIVYF